MYKLDTFLSGETAGCAKKPRPSHIRTEELHTLMRALCP